MTTSSSNGSKSRETLRCAKRVIIKAGTSIVANSNGQPSLTRLGAIVEQISELVQNGTEVIFVSSGAVGMGKKLLRKQGRLNLSVNELHKAQEKVDDMQSFGARMDDHLANSLSLNLKSSPSLSDLLTIDDEEEKVASRESKKQYDSACAAAGQFELMNLYSSLFGQCDITASQILVTQADFQDEFRLKNLKYAVERLLSLGIIPIVNENDAVSANSGYTNSDIFSDNDSLASICARNFGAEVLVILTDVNGVYDKPPSAKNANLIKFYPNDSAGIEIGDKSAQGRGGMGAKIDAAIEAVQPYAGSKCTACVVVSGHDLDSIRSVLGHSKEGISDSQKGTLFVTPGTGLYNEAMREMEEETAALVVNVSDEARAMANASRTEARKLQGLPIEERRAILNAVADALVEKKEQLLKANALDLEAAKENHVALPLFRRLKLSDEKLLTLASGIRQIANQADPLGVVKSKRELADGLLLSQITVPIGVLMIIFESRPDSLPQISALALASGNGLLLKGGKEAYHSNAALHEVIGTAIESGSGGKITRDIIALVTSRGQVADMLNLDDVIDLVIPRGGNELVSYIKANTRIPVLGHADGVCHVYVAASASVDDACLAVVDSKVDYPSACNAMETLLLHTDTLSNGVALNILMHLRSAGVKCLGGPVAMKSGLCDVAAEEMKCEYGDLTCMVEMVNNKDEAIDWIHKHGSGHTEAIICSDDDSEGEYFLKHVDAACVFKNASTRFADGYRFGLGAEVGISTGRIHARGPVGVEGLLTTKWQLRSNGVNYVAQYGGQDASKKYTHKELM